MSMLPLLLCAALAWLVVHAAEDMAYAVRGETSPRLKYRQERWQARRARWARTGQPTVRRDRPKKTLGPARRYLGDLWTDAWADATTRRRDRRADDHAARTAARTAHADLLADLTHDDQEERSREREERQRRLVPAGAATPTDPNPARPPNAGRFPPRQDVVDGDQPAEPEPAVRTPTPAELERMFALPAANPTPTNSVDPAGSTADNTTQEEPSMDSTTPPEVIGQTGAKNYADKMNKAAAAAVASLEQTIAAATAGKVGPNVISHFAAAQEAAQAMASALDAAHAELARADTIQEGYNANPDAGDKQWMTEGQ